MCYIELFILSVILVIAVIYDLSGYRIPNRLIIVGYFLGAILQLQKNGSKGIGVLFLGLWVPILLLWPIWKIKMIGAGDIKLYSVIGTMLGYKTSISCIWNSLLLASGYALLLIVMKKSFRKRVKNLLIYILTVLQTGKQNPYYDIKKDGYQNTIHFSIAVLCGTILCFLLPK